MLRADFRPLTRHCSLEKCGPAPGRGDAGCRYRWEWKDHIPRWVRSLYPNYTYTDAIPEFRKFVHETEKELQHLFQTIDYNHDGKISKDELRSALRTAGLTVPNSNLDKFFSEVDTNNDGTISFEEWRYVPSQFAVVTTGGIGVASHTVEARTD